MGNKYFTNSITSSPAFKGHTLTTNEKGEKEYQFYLPTKKQNEVKPEAVLLNKNGEIIKDLTSELKKTKGDIPVWTLPTSSIEDKDTSIAYRFINNGNIILDNTITTKDGKYNETILASRPALEMPRQMYHLMPDSFNPNKGELLVDEFGNEVQRNHFNKFGGTISEIIAKIQDIKNLGAKRIISTPIFGDDTVSNHGYWTVNPYQTTSTLGNINDFKKLQVELFKKGMGWVADGAFANEGLEGIHLQDIVRWGENSPYADWFDMKDFSQNGLRFGVLPPTGSEAEKHYDLKLINSPVKYVFDKDGNIAEDFGKINPDYDKTKPTYLQQFDRRLMDDNYINSPELLQTYTKKQLEDTHAIKNYKDSVQLLSFRVDPQNVKAKLAEMKNISVGEQTSTHSVYRNMLRKWDNFSLEHVDKDGTIRNWTGKKDIVALNYTNKDVQDYIANTAKYWTDETDKTLTTYVAKKLANERFNLSEEIQKITKLFNVNLSETELKNILTEGKYKIQLSPVKDTIKESLKEFPLVAAEAPREIASLFSDPLINKNEMLDKIYEKQITPIVENIFKEACPTAFKNGKLTDEGKNLFRLVSSDIMRYLSAYILSGKTPSVSFENGYNKIEIPENFNEKVFNNLNYESASRKEAIDKLLDTFDSGSKTLKDNKKVQMDIEKIIHNTLDGVDFDLIKIAKILISKVEAGLEWRIDASKDIMDLDLINQGKADAKTTFKVVQDFWKKFVDTVRLYNPKAYTIGEVTSLGDFFNDADNVEKTFIKETGFTTQSNYSHIFNVLNRIVHGAPEEAYGGPQHVSISGDGYNLSSALRGFFNSGYADNIRYSHEFVDNHDKPRALHGYAINIADFFGLSDEHKQEVLESEKFKSLASSIKESKSKIWGKDAKSLSNEDIFYFIKGDDSLFTDSEIKNAFLSKASGKKLFAEYRSNLEFVKNQIKDKNGINAIRDALIESLNNAKDKIGLDETQQKAISKAINDYSTGAISKTAEEHFKTRPYNLVIEDAVRKADLGLDENKTKKIIAGIHEEMLKPAFSKYKSMMEILVSLPGNPTIYAGDEFGETGFETPGNNVYQHNRNQIHRKWINDSDRNEFSKFNDETKKIFSLRNKKCFAPFVDGDTLVLDNFAGNNVGGVYRYNKNSDAIAIFNTNGFNNTRSAAYVTPTKISEIPIKADFDITNAYGTNKFFRMNINGQKVENEFYKVVNNILKGFKNADCTEELSEINLTDAATYFVRALKKTTIDKAPSLTEALKAQALSGIKKAL